MNYSLIFSLIALTAQSPNETTLNKLDRAYENIVVKYTDPSHIREFDLDRREVSAFMVEKMNTVSNRGGCVPSTDVLHHLIDDNPGKTFEWLVDKYDQFSPVGCAAMIEGLRHLDNRESYQLLIMFLEDKREVVNKYELILSPPAPGINLSYMRVCDWAFQSITYLLDLQKCLPRQIPRHLQNSEPFSERDKFIKQIKGWWSNDSVNFLAKKTLLSIKRPLLQKKVQNLLNKNLN